MFGLTWRIRAGRRLHAFLRRKSHYSSSIVDGLWCDDPSAQSSKFLRHWARKHQDLLRAIITHTHACSAYGFCRACIDCEQFRCGERASGFLGDWRCGDQRRAGRGWRVPLPLQSGASLERRSDRLPGPAGKAHLHQFFGNTAANAHSTYESLRTTGESTCNSPLNRSAYWMPAMMNGKGQVVRPDYVSIYYKRFPRSSPECDPASAVAVGICRTLPRGLRMVFGFNMATGKYDNDRRWPAAAYYTCDGATARAGHYNTITEAAANCPSAPNPDGSYNKLGAVISAPECWDGKNLDSPDHRSHMSYAQLDATSKYRCPSTHPYLLPSFTMSVAYTVDANKDGWHLSSDVMPGMPAMPAGSTFHADWFGAWDDQIMQIWTEHCIDKLLNCSGADLGNGKQMKMFSDSHGA
jgi:hypothetical protein